MTWGNFGDYYNFIMTDEVALSDIFDNLTIL